MKEKDIKYKNVSEEEASKELLKHRDEILSNFTKAYLAETGLLPSQIELVSTQTKEINKIITTYSFRRKDEQGK